MLNTVFLFLLALGFLPLLFIVFFLFTLLLPCSLLMSPLVAVLIIVILELLGGLLMGLSLLLESVEVLVRVIVIIRDAILSFPRGLQLAFTQAEGVAQFFGGLVLNQVGGVIV